jgi:hypothetical protein
LGEGLTIPQCENESVLRNIHRQNLESGLSIWYDLSNDRRDIGTWNVRSLYRAGSLTAAVKELARYKLDLLGLQEVRWDKGGTVTAGDYNFLWERK